MFSRATSEARERHVVARDTSEDKLQSVRQAVAKLKLCITSEDLVRGKAIHEQAAQSGDDINLYLASTLIKLYATCACMVDAQRVFDKIPEPDLVLWTALILGYADNGDGTTAFSLFTRMQTQGVEPNSRTLVALLKACTCASSPGESLKRRLEKGMAIHSQAVASRKFNVFVGNAAVHMYAKLGSLTDARKTFETMARRDVVTWNSMILGYVENGEPLLALELFSAMDNESECLPNSFTFVAVMQACGKVAGKEDGEPPKLKSLEVAFAVHGKGAERRCLGELLVANTAVDMYAKCGSMLDAVRVFERMKNHSTVTWTTLILGYLGNGEPELASQCFTRMQRAGCSPNCHTFVSALKACASPQAVKRLHAAVVRVEEIDDVLTNSLIDVYVKFGSVSDAQHVFDSAYTVNSVTWTSLIAGYSHRGDVGAVLDRFQRMEEQDGQPNGVTFLCMLAACSHAGLVEKGREMFKKMQAGYGISPGIEHYVCMVDMLGRVNELDAAVEMLKQMPHEGNAAVWTALLDSCRKWKNTEVGKLAFENLVRVDQGQSAAYDLMASIYADDKRTFKYN